MPIDPAQEAQTLRAQAVTLAEPHPMAQAVIDAHTQARRHRAAAEKHAFQLLSDVFGIDLPQALSFKDEETGDLYALDINVSLRLVQRGNHDGS